MFSFLMCIQILQGDKLVDPLEWRFLISGMSLGKRDIPNPDTSWVGACRRPLGMKQLQ